MIVTVNPTIMAGTVVRWYRNENAYSASDETVSASRNGVRIYGYLHEVPPDALADAQAAFAALRRDEDADVRHLATHHSRVLAGGLRPIKRDAS